MSETTASSEPARDTDVYRVKAAVDALLRMEAHLTVEADRKEAEGKPASFDHANRHGCAMGVLALELHRGRVDDAMKVADQAISERVRETLAEGVDLIAEVLEEAQLRGSTKRDLEAWYVKLRRMAGNL